MSETRKTGIQTGGDADTELYVYPPEASVSYGVRMAYRLLERDLEKALRFVGVSRGQWYFLRALWIEDGLTQRELSDRVHMREPTTVLALKGMEKSKLIYRVREEGDLRKVRVFLTEAGHGLRNILLPMLKVIDERATADVAPRDLGLFLRVLDQITEKLRAAEDKDPLVLDHRSLEHSPCWKMLPAKPLAGSGRQRASPAASSGQNGPIRSQMLRNFNACATCYASSRGSPRCPSRTG